MEINITNVIEKTLKDLIKGTKGEQISQLYHKFSNQANFAIIGLIGVLLNFLITNIFRNFFGTVLGIIAMLGWTWLMTVGPFGYMWGFTEKPKPKTKQQQKKKQKIITPVPQEILDSSPQSPKEHHLNWDKKDAVDAYEYRDQHKDKKQGS